MIDLLNDTPVEETKKEATVSNEEVLKLVNELKTSIEKINTNFGNELKKQDDKIKSFADNYMKSTKVEKQEIIKDAKEEWDKNDPRWLF